MTDEELRFLEDLIELKWKTALLDWCPESYQDPDSARESLAKKINYVRFALTQNHKYLTDD
jgi:hypothetical protein